MEESRRSHESRSIGTGQVGAVEFLYFTKTILAIDFTSSATRETK
jgi:hypothetical protein